MTRFLIGGAATALAIASVAAAAQPAPPPPPGVAQGTVAAPMAPGAPHVRMMIRSDRVMTRNEVVDHVNKLFARLDTNRDGFITRDEIDAMHEKMAAAMAKSGDVEKRLTEHGVFMDDRGAMFDRLDTNHDGNISRQEFMAGKPQVREERVMIMRDGPDGAPGMGMHMGGMHRAAMEMHGFGGRLFEMADANHDGRVSLAEAQAAALAHFDKADLNHDGKITPDERQQGRKGIRMERRRG